MPWSSWEGAGRVGLRPGSQVALWSVRVRTRWGNTMTPPMWASSNHVWDNSYTWLLSSNRRFCGSKTKEWHVSWTRWVGEGMQTDCTAPPLALEDCAAKGGKTYFDNDVGHPWTMLHGSATEQGSTGLELQWTVEAIGNHRGKSMNGAHRDFEWDLGGSSSSITR